MQNLVESSSVWMVLQKSGSHVGATDGARWRYHARSELHAVPRKKICRKLKKEKLYTKSFID